MDGEDDYVFCQYVVFAGPLISIDSDRNAQDLRSPIVGDPSHFSICIYSYTLMVYVREIILIVLIGTIWTTFGSII